MAVSKPAAGIGLYAVPISIGDGQESVEIKMFALNFYSEYYEEVLRNGRKTVTIRLGDKTDKYVAGMIVWVTIGPRFGRRQKLFTAIIDRVEVKTIDALSPREIQKENPEFRNTEDLVNLLRRIYSDDISVEDTVTVIHFSEVSEYL